jgi:GPI-anchor transamidase subunit GAA1
VNIVGILHSPRTSGREAIVLSTRTLHERFSVQMKNPTSSLALGITIMQHLRTSNWLSKDVIFVVTDGQYEDEGIRAWLHQYHHIMGPYGANYFFFEHALGLIHQNFTSTQTIRDQADFGRAGHIRGAIALDFFEENFTYLILCPEGINGKLPNLDLLNAIDRVASFGESSYTILMNVHDPLVKFLHSWTAIDFRSMPVPLFQFISFVLHGASGVPTGDHGWFHMYNIDAVTLRLHTGLIPGGRGQYGPILRVGR